LKLIKTNKEDLRPPLIICRPFRTLVNWHLCK